MTNRHRDTTHHCTCDSYSPGHEGPCSELVEWSTVRPGHWIMDDGAQLPVESITAGQDGRLVVVLGGAMSPIYPEPFHIVERWTE